MQLMPATARRFGVRNVFNIEQNIRAGISYLSWLMTTFNGDLRLVTAAYLVGEGRILERGLDYASPEAFKYVTVVARPESTVRNNSTEGTGLNGNQSDLAKEPFMPKMWQPAPSHLNPSPPTGARGTEVVSFSHHAQLFLRSQDDAQMGLPVRSKLQSYLCLFS
jgi:hypothetical protein